MLQKNNFDKYPKIRNFLFEPEYSFYRFISILILVVSVGWPITSYYDQKKIKAFEKSKITFGIVKDVHTPSRSSECKVDFYYFNNKGRKINVESISAMMTCANYRSKGDTIIIRYSLTDDSYIEIIECYWNDNLKKKYGFYKWY